MDLDGEQLEAVATFCYLGDVTGERGGCQDAITARIRSAWKKFRELLPILTCRGISLLNRGHFYNSCVRNVLLYASETWPVTSVDIARLARSDHAMIRWICASKLSDREPVKSLRARLGLASVDEVIRWNRLRWYGHLQRMDKNRWPRKIESINIPGNYPRGRPRKRWIDCTKDDLKSTGLKPHQAMDREWWRRNIKPDRHGKTSNPRTRGRNRSKIDE